MFRRVLVANGGAIAVRAIRTVNAQAGELGQLLVELEPIAGRPAL